MLQETYISLECVALFGLSKSDLQILISFAKELTFTRGKKKSHNTKSPSAIPGRSQRKQWIRTHIFRPLREMEREK